MYPGSSQDGMCARFAWAGIGGVPMFAIGIVSSLVLILYYLGRLWLLLKSKNPRTGSNRQRG